MNTRASALQNQFVLKKTLLLIIAICIQGCNLMAEVTVHWLRPEIKDRPFYGVIGQFQHGSGIGIVIDYQDFFGPCKECDMIATLPFNVNGPAFVVERVDLQLSVPSNVRWLDDSDLNWDPSLGSGWIQFPIIGKEFVYVRNYPWTWWPKFNDWVYIVYGGHYGGEDFNGGVINGDIGFFFWFPRDGWYWTTRRLYPWFWSFDEADWIFLK